MRRIFPAGGRRRPGPCLVTLARNDAPWQAVGLSATADLTTEWQDFRLRFTGTIDEPDAILRMNLGDDVIEVEFADVTLLPRVLRVEVGGGDSADDCYPTAVPRRDSAPRRTGVALASRRSRPEDTPHEPGSGRA